MKEKCPLNIVLWVVKFLSEIYKIRKIGQKSTKEIIVAFKYI
jgi:hypothetical protein